MADDSDNTSGIGSEKYVETMQQAGLHLDYGTPSDAAAYLRTLDRIGRKEDVSQNLPAPIKFGSKKLPPLETLESAQNSLMNSVVSGTSKYMQAAQAEIENGRLADAADNLRKSDAFAGVREDIISRNYKSAADRLDAIADMPDSIKHLRDSRHKKLPPTFAPESAQNSLMENVDSEMSKYMQAAQAEIHNGHLADASDNLRKSEAFRGVREYIESKDYQLAADRLDAIAEMPDSIERLRGPEHKKLPPAPVSKSAEADFKSEVHHAQDALFAKAAREKATGDNRAAASDIRTGEVYKQVEADLEKGNYSQAADDLEKIGNTPSPKPPEQSNAKLGGLIPLELSVALSGHGIKVPDAVPTQSVLLTEKHQMDSVAPKGPSITLA